MKFYLPQPARGKFVNKQFDNLQIQLLFRGFSFVSQHSQKKESKNTIKTSTKEKETSLCGFLVLCLILSNHSYCKFTRADRLTRYYCFSLNQAFFEELRLKPTLDT